MRTRCAQHRSIIVCLLLSYKHVRVLGKHFILLHQIMPIMVCCVFSVVLLICWEAGINMKINVFCLRLDVDFNAKLFRIFLFIEFCLPFCNHMWMLFAYWHCAFHVLLYAFQGQGNSWIRKTSLSLILICQSLLIYLPWWILKDPEDKYWEKIEP